MGRLCVVTVVLGLEGLIPSLPNESTKKYIFMYMHVGTFRVHIPVFL